MADESVLKLAETPDLTPPQNSDALPPADRGDLDINEEDLSAHILEQMTNMFSDRVSRGHREMVDYEIKSYYGVKNEVLRNFPYPGASAFPPPLVPVLVDTAYANIIASLIPQSRKNDAVNVIGESIEDSRISRGPLTKLMNYVARKEMNFGREMDKMVFSSFLHGTGFIKTFFDAGSGKVLTLRIDHENMLVPIDASGLSAEDSEIVVQQVPLTWNDLQFRKDLGIYKYPDEIIPGVNIASWQDTESSRQLMDSISGVDLIRRRKRETYWIAECYLTYRPKNGSGPYGRTGAGSKAKELIVWISPNGGKIQRVRLNREGDRPFTDGHAYPYKDNRYYSMSLPLKVKNIAEEMEYADKQNVDAMDRAIRPAGFVDDTGSFNPMVHQRVPGGIYPKGKANTIEWEPQPPIDRGFERRISMLWEQAERLTGLIDIMQGPEANTARTLGEVEIRTSRADVRFRAIFQRFKESAEDVMNKAYKTIDLYMDRKKISRIVGYSDFMKVDEMFPKGKDGQLEGKFDFNFSGKLLSDQDDEERKIITFAKTFLADPTMNANPLNVYRVHRKLANVFGVEDFESLVEPPPEFGTISVEEFIQRVVSGQSDIVLRPGIDADRFLFELRIFMKSDTFRNLSESQKQEIIGGVKKAFLFQQGKVEAMRRAAEIKQDMARPIPAELPNGGLRSVPSSQSGIPV